MTTTTLIDRYRNASVAVIQNDRALKYVGKFSELDILKSERLERSADEYRQLILNDGAIDVEIRYNNNTANYNVVITY